MIIFERIKYKNVLSSGNVWQEFDFQRTNQALLVGRNGSGKSTILDALIFVLYGKAFRKIRLDQLINSINNRELLVELEFKIGNSQYKIIRGMKPDIFEVYVNDELRKQDASKRDYQKYLENNILKMSDKTFKQIVILGSTSYVPFMRLDKGERRAIIEDLLDIQVFSLMNIIIKNRGYLLSRDYKEIQTNLRLITSQCDLIKEHIEKTEKQTAENKTKIEVKLENVLKEIKDLENDNVVLTDSIADIKTDDSAKVSAEKQIQQMKTFKAQITSNLKKHQNTQTFFKDNEACPTCDQEIDSEMRDSKISHHTNKIVSLEDGLDKLADTIKSTSTKINKLSKSLDEVKSLHENVKRNRIKISSKNELVDDYENDLTLFETTEDVSEDKNKIVALEENITLEQAKRNKMSEQGRYYSVMLEMLKDSGIKTSIIKSYLPIINKLVRKYLDILEFNVDFRFDENFNEIMKSRFRDNFSYANFSEGEKMRIDLALLFVWRELARMRNSAATNLLILDEIGDSSLDADGFESFMKIIGETNYEQNVLVISHKVDIMADKFTTIYTFEKVKDFSEMTT